MNNVIKKILNSVRFGQASKVEHDILYKYLLYEISDLRKKLRYVIAHDPYYQKVMEQTRSSFNFQWGNLKEGEFLLSNSEFVKNVEDIILGYTQLNKDWFEGKNILDAGCGNGRFSYGLASMHANVTAVDQSDYGILNVVEIAKQNDLSISFLKKNLLEDLNFNMKFDLVWSYGVLHHTGDTYKAYKNIVQYVKKGGYLFLMLYGEPRFDHPEDFYELYQYERLRRIASNKSFEEKVAILEKDKVVDDIHGWFDAISPQINDLYHFEEVESWLISEGFTEIKLTNENRNLHIVALKA